MTEPTTPDDGPLAGSYEISLILGCSTARVRQLTQRPDFPPPLARLSIGNVWRTEDIHAWIKTWPRKTGRPRKTRPNEPQDG